MEIIVAILSTLTITSSLFAQDDLTKATDSVTSEGKRLYKSEMASWYGTDIFLDKFKDQKSNIGGYFSYSDKNQNICIFFSKGDQPKVIGTISFDSTFEVDRAKADGKVRDFTSYESDVYIIRKKALEEINNDTLFKTYKNTKLNIIPLYGNNERKVYVLTGPDVSGVVVFGNDYLLTFDKENNLVSKKSLHRNIIPINYGQDKNNTAIATIHNHLPETGNLITATDICTLMLYEKFTKWGQHIVMSDNYVSIWNCDKNQLVALTRQAWDKIYSDQKTRNKD